jgi:uncharacterized protein (TIRG00374 family)
MWRRLLYVLSILLGIAGFAAIPFIVGLQEVLRSIGEVGWRCIVIFVVNASGTLIMPAVGWWLLMRAEGMAVSLSTAVRAALMGFPLDFIVPSVYLGGEPLKTVYVAHVCHLPGQRVLATIIMAKFQEFGGLIFGMVVAAALFIWHTDSLPTRSAILLMGVLSGLTGLFGLTLYAFASHLQPIGRLIDCLARCRFLRARMARLRSPVAEMETLISTTLTTRLRVFLLAQCITCLPVVSLFIRPWIFFQALPDTRVGFDQLCVIFVLTNLVHALTLVPGGLGWFEATMAAYASAVGIGDAKGAAFALVSRIADLALLMLGGWLIVHAGLTQLARGQAKSFG